MFCTNRRRRSNSLALAVAVAIAFGVSFGAAPARAFTPDRCQNNTECRKHNDRGFKRVAAFDYQGALEAFQMAYDLQPEPRLLVNIGRCLFHLGRPHEALHYYTRFEKTPNFEPDPAIKQAAVQFIAESRAAIASAPRSDSGMLVLSVREPKAHVLIDGKEVGRGPLTRSYDLPAGKHQISSFGQSNEEREVMIVAGKELELNLGSETPRPGEDPMRQRTPRPRWRIGVGATALVLGLGLTIAGAAVLSVNGRCTQLDDSGGCVPVISPEGVRQAQLFDTVPMGVGLLVPGLLLTGTGIALIAVPGRAQTEIALRGSTGPELLVQF